MIQAIDSHHHFWHYDPAEYGWIGLEMDVLRRDFLPADLEREMRAAGVEGAVSVQARQTLEETEWLLSLAGQHSFVRGVVGWVPLCENGPAGVLEKFATHPKLKGVRHVVQDEPDERFLLREDFNRGIGELRRFDLVYDILIYARHLRAAIEFVDRHPDQVFVLDHAAKPRIAAREREPWATEIGELARRENVYSKVSGLVTEADRQHWTAEAVRPYFDRVLEVFTPERVMFGTDWPVLNLAGEYAGWTHLVREWVAHLSDSEQERILRGTAAEVYRL